MLSQTLHKIRRKTSIVAAGFVAENVNEEHTRATRFAGGFELPTFWFPPQADSIQLSYGRTVFKL